MCLFLLSLLDVPLLRRQGHSALTTLRSHIMMYFNYSPLVLSFYTSHTPHYSFYYPKMSTSADWSHGVDPMPSIEPSSDLFDGDILGDELIDIYNAAVVGGSDDDTMDGKLGGGSFARVNALFINQSL
jgi:hypothetical protein